jgi:hypothetical protein
MSAATKVEGQQTVSGALSSNAKYLKNIRGLFVNLELRIAAK